MPFDWKAACEAAHAHVDHMAASLPQSTAASRICPECGNPVFLITGQRSGKSWFVHDVRGDSCPFSRLGTRIKFKSRDEAMTAEQIFLCKPSQNFPTSTPEPRSASVPSAKTDGANAYAI